MPIHVPENVLSNLSRAGQRQRLEEDYRRGHFVFRQQRAAMGYDVFRRQWHRRQQRWRILQHNSARHALAHHSTREPEYCALLHAGQLKHDRLNLRAVHILTAHQDHVLRPVENPYVAVRQERGDVPGSKPAIGEAALRFFVVVPIPAEHSLAPDEDFTRLADGAVETTHVESTVTSAISNLPHDANVNERERPSRCEDALPQQSVRRRGGGGMNFGGWNDRHRDLPAAFGHAVRREEFAADERESAPHISVRYR